MRRITLSSLILTILLCACQHTATKTPINKATKSNSQKVLDAEILGLVLNPKIFDHHYLRVRGYLHIGQEQNGLYDDKYDYDKSIQEDALWIDTTTLKSKFPNCKQFSAKYVLIEGKFDAHNVNDTGSWAGKLTDIKKIEFWNPTK